MILTEIFGNVSRPRLKALNVSEAGCVFVFRWKKWRKESTQFEPLDTAGINFWDDERSPKPQLLLQL